MILNSMSYVAQIGGCANHVVIKGILRLHGRCATGRMIMGSRFNFHFNPVNPYTYKKNDKYSTMKRGITFYFQPHKEQYKKMPPSKLQRSLCPIQYFAQLIHDSILPFILGAIKLKKEKYSENTDLYRGRKKQLHKNGQTIFFTLSTIKWMPKNKSKFLSNIISGRSLRLIKKVELDHNIIDCNRKKIWKAFWPRIPLFSPLSLNRTNMQAMRVSKLINAKELMSNIEIKTINSAIKEKILSHVIFNRKSFFFLDIQLFHQNIYQSLSYIMPISMKHKLRASI